MVIDVAGIVDERSALPDTFSAMMKTTPSVALAVTFLLLAGCGDSAESPGSATDDDPLPLRAAYTECLDRTDSLMVESIGESNHTAEEFMAIEAGDTRLSIGQPRGDIASAIALGATRCVLEETGAPSAIADKMTNTTALDGERQDS